MIIALCGPAAAGKGTLARMLAEYLDLSHYDFGLIFRGIAFLNHRWELEEIRSLISKQYLRIEGGQFILRWLNLTSHLVSEEVGLRTARMVKEKPEAFIQSACTMVRDRNFVCDGRTCGSEIYPDANFIFYITADVEERKKRRVRNIGESKAFARRECLDSQRLQIPPRAIIIETTGKTKEESLEEILVCLKDRELVL